MKLINIEPMEDGVPVKVGRAAFETVTLQFSHDEFHVVRDMLQEGIEYLKLLQGKYKMLAKDIEGLSEDEANRRIIDVPDEEEILANDLDDLRWRIKRTEKLLVEANAFSKVIEGIVSDNNLARQL